MVIKSLHLQVQEMRQSFFDEGYLNSQYTQLEALAKDTNPNFIIEIITLYFRDSPNVIASLEHELERDPIEVPMITKCILQLESSSASIGASKVFKELQKANTSLKASNTEGIKVALGDIKKEHSKLRAKFETYFQLMRQAGPTDVAVNSS
ncbi:pseudo histidine-containing phosphotransfer protein 2 isoform X1 [Arabidopsis lyrata subsp. lyrata]|uniref:pseudo histidine-containing phosphotransfer protein 2 isoform X1 n=1 Tax=Arabidopsis lyrata subsp. lyrata TaxID=81972 RepID=UPI000A29C839|nr:pseudo histidine-containing phosphotransfer protein 2 isoform X1 [Arabidopsis lyrata subsp. lyrata]|eukprot:XP_020879070.1 pseudo histidine-containing phosphotransfer protein 2 isoform X1 [Arabidopsis lyrata subsp. lyrata]